jgi:hypothetical protein
VTKEVKGRAVAGGQSGLLDPRASAPLKDVGRAGAVAADGVVLEARAGDEGVAV